MLTASSSRWNILDCRSESPASAFTISPLRPQSRGGAEYMRPFAGGAAAALRSGECSASCRACDAASSSIARWQQSLRSWVATQVWSIDPPKLHRQRVKLLGIVDAGVRRPHLQPRRETTVYIDARAALASASQQQQHKAQLPVEQHLPAARQRRKTHLRQVAPHFGLQVHGDVTFLRAAGKPQTDAGPASQHVPACRSLQ